MESAPVIEDLQPLLASPELRVVVDSVRDYAIFLLDINGTVLSWNPGAQRIKGYAPQEIIGQSFTRFYTPEDRARGRPFELLAEAVREGRSEEEGWRVRNDGTRFWADVVISAIRGSGGQVRGFVKVTRDLTDRLRAEEQLRQGEERLRLMIGSVREYAIFMLDPQGRVATWNAGAAALKGYEASEIIGQHISRFYRPEDLPAQKAERELGIAAETGRFEEEAWRVRKDGSRFWANVVLSAVRNASGELIGFTKVTRDMTDRMRADEQIRERARQQSLLADLGLHALRTPELPKVIEEAVRTVRQTLELDEVRVLRAGEEKPPGATSVSIHASTVGAPPYGELAVWGAPGSRELGFLQAVANVIAAAVGRAQVEDQLRSAERKAVEEREKTGRANEALRERDEFISVAAHELRTPVTALTLKLQSLERAVNIREAKPGRLEGAIRQTDRLARLIDRLLDVSHIAQQGLRMSREKFDLAALVRQVVDDFRDPAAQAGTALELEIDEPVEGVWDRLRIEQVLVNILSNALKYGAGKPVSLRVESDPDGVRVTVADRGIGIAAGDAGRLFGKFQRAASIRHYGGMGLGLYITRHIVEAHGGTITVESEQGQGSTFVVELPRFPPAEAAAGEPAEGARA
jgi:PAS domain S-box-containing protein